LTSPFQTGGLSPVRLAAILGLPASTIGAVLARAGLPGLAEVDRLTGQLLRGRRHRHRRYEHPHAGDLLHVDVKKLGRVPDGGGWRVHGRSEEVRGRGNGWDYVHVAVDDHSRLAYAEVLPDERVASCAAFLRRAVAWLAARGVIVRRVLTDKRPQLPGRRGLDRHLRRAVHRQAVHPARPALDEWKAERFNRTLQAEWAYARPWISNADRTAALDGWLAHYNTARSHSALGGYPPISRLTA
jgi:transposase InsO family protein